MITIGYTIGSSRLICAIGAALSLPVAAHAETVVQPAEPGFKVGYRQQVPTESIEEQVPAGETVDDWSRMITTQVFPGLAAREARLNRQALDSFSDHIRSGWFQACPGATASPAQPLSVGAYVAAEFRLDCPENPGTGKPETMISRVIAGKNDLFSVQVAFRHRPLPSEVAWAQAHLAKVTLRP